MNSTKTNILLAGILLMLLFPVSVSFAAETPDAGPAPVAVMPETAFEFPPVVEGESVSHDFLIQNRGDAVLTVLEVKTT